MDRQLITVQHNTMDQIYVPAVLWQCAIMTARSTTSKRAVCLKMSCQEKNQDLLQPLPLFRAI